MQLLAHLSYRGSALFADSNLFCWPRGIEDARAILAAETSSYRRRLGTGSGKTFVRNHVRHRSPWAARAWHRNGFNVARGAAKPRCWEQTSIRVFSSTEGSDSRRNANVGGGDRRSRDLEGLWVRNVVSFSAGLSAPAPRVIGAMLRACSNSGKASFALRCRSRT